MQKKVRLRSVSGANALQSKSCRCLARVGGAWVEFLRVAPYSASTKNQVAVVATGNAMSAYRSEHSGRAMRVFRQLRQFAFCTSPLPPVGNGAAFVFGAHCSSCHTITQPPRVRVAFILGRRSGYRRYSGGSGDTGGVWGDPYSACRQS